MKKTCWDWRTGCFWSTLLLARLDEEIVGGFVQKYLDTRLCGNFDGKSDVRFLVTLLSENNQLSWCLNLNWASETWYLSQRRWNIGITELLLGTLWNSSNGSFPTGDARRVAPWISGPTDLEDKIAETCSVPATKRLGSLSSGTDIDKIRIFGESCCYTTWEDVTRWSNNPLRMVDITNSCWTSRMV